MSLGKGKSWITITHSANRSGSRTLIGCSMATKDILRAPIFFLLAGIPIPSSPAQQVMMKIQSVPTPNFQGKTLQQVRDAAVLPNGSQMFVEIYPQGPTVGVVVSPSPQPETPIIPG